MTLLRNEGYRIQFDIDIRPRLVHEDGVTVMSRRHIDGYSFQVPAQLRQFFSVATVRDPETGVLLGSIDVSGPLRTVHPAMLALVTATAQLAEGQLRAQQGN